VEGGVFLTSSQLIPDATIRSAGSTFGNSFAYSFIPSAPASFMSSLLFFLESGICTEALWAHYISIRLLTRFVLGELDLLADLAEVFFDP